MAGNRRAGVLAVLRIGAIPVVLDQSWLVIMGLLTWTLARSYFPGAAPGYDAAIYWVAGALSALSFVACILLHELSHAFTARAFGIPVAGITLFLFGGVAHLSASASGAGVEFLIALAGPLMSVLLGGLAYYWAAPFADAAGPFGPLLATWCRYLAIMNLGLIMFNLIPGFPLDGGRMLRALVWGLTGNLARATRFASALGALVGIGLIALGAFTMVTGRFLSGFWYGMLGSMLFQAANETHRATRAPAARP